MNGNIEAARQLLIEELNRLADIVTNEDVIAIENAIAASEEMAQSNNNPTPETAESSGDD